MSQLPGVVWGGPAWELSSDSASPGHLLSWGRWGRRGRWGHECWPEVRPSLPGPVSDISFCVAPGPSSNTASASGFLFLFLQEGGSSSQQLHSRGITDNGLAAHLVCVCGAPHLEFLSFTSFIQQISLDYQVYTRYASWGQGRSCEPNRQKSPPVWSFIPWCWPSTHSAL